MSEDKNYLLFVYKKHEVYEKYIFWLVYNNWLTWSWILEKSAVKLLKKSVGDASWVFGGTYALKEKFEIN